MSGKAYIFVKNTHICFRSKRSSYTTCKGKRKVKGISNSFSFNTEFRKLKIPGIIESKENKISQLEKQIQKVVKKIREIKGINDINIKRADTQEKKESLQKKLDISEKQKQALENQIVQIRTEITNLRTEQNTIENANQGKKIEFQDFHPDFIQKHTVSDQDLTKLLTPGLTDKDVQEIGERRRRDGEYTNTIVGTLKDIENTEFKAPKLSSNGEYLVFESTQEKNLIELTRNSAGTWKRAKVDIKPFKVGVRPVTGQIFHYES